MKVLVLGGAGDMGSRTVRDLAEQPQVEALVIGDYNQAAAQALADDLASPKVTPLKVDANDRRALVQAMADCDVVASALGPFYRFEAKCAEAAIEARRHYVSLCDDYDAAQAVLELDQKARDGGVTVLTGLGWTPGVSNVLARKAADQLDETEEIHVAWGSSASDSEGFAVILHTLHIFTGMVPSFRDGELVRVPAGSGKETVLFPQPLGPCNVFHLGHPEPVTLPRTFGGVKTVTLKGGLSENLLNTLAILLSKLRLTATAGRRDALAKLLKLVLPALSKIGKPTNPCSAVRVDVKGKRNGQPVKLTYGAADHMDNLTGVPLAIGALMLGRGDVTERGVVAPEACVSPDLFIEELGRRGITVCEGDDLTAAIS
jgi:lysine 6-dehydrogenase